MYSPKFCNGSVSKIEQFPEMEWHLKTVFLDVFHRFLGAGAQSLSSNDSASLDVSQVKQSLSVEIPCSAQKTMREGESGVTFLMCSPSTFPTKVSKIFGCFRFPEVAQFVPGYRNLFRIHIEQKLGTCNGFWNQSATCFAYKSFISETSCFKTIDKIN